MVTYAPSSLTYGCLYSNPNANPSLYHYPHFTYLTPVFISGEFACHQPRVASAWCSAALHSKFDGPNSNAQRARIGVHHECAEQGPNPFQGGVWAASTRSVLWWYPTRTWAQALGLQRVQSGHPSVVVAFRRWDGQSVAKAGTIHIILALTRHSNAIPYVEPPLSQPA